MAGKMTSVDLTGLQKAINTFSNGVANFDTEYKNMQGTATSISASWTGAASSAFEGALNSWLEDFYKVITVLNDMENSLTQNHSLLNQANERTISAAQRAASGITAPPLKGF